MSLAVTPIAATEKWSGGASLASGTVNTRLKEIQDFVNAATWPTVKLTDLTPGYFPFHVTDAAGLMDSNIYTNGVNVFLGDTTNTKMSQGLTIQQSWYDDEAQAWKSVDVGHPFTATAEADTFGSVMKAHASAGGLKLLGLRSSAGGNAQAVHIQGFLGEAADTTKTVAGLGVVHLSGCVTDGGTGIAGVAADGNVLTIATNTVTRFIFDAEGSGHGDVEWVAFDKYDDLALTRTVEEELLRQETPRMTAHRRTLERAGIIGKGSWHFERGRPRAMINFTRLAMLHHGALLQVAERFRSIESRMRALEG